MSNAAVPATALRAQLNLDSARRTTCRVRSRMQAFDGGMDRVPQIVARKAFRDALRILREASR